MARNAAQTEQAYNVSYTLDFEEPLSWQSTFVNDLSFQGIPLPSEYQQKSIDELIHRTPLVQDTLPITPTLENTGLSLTLLDNSSDLKSHPELDKLVTDRNGDPMALANYVFNEIELTDVIGYNTTSNPIKSSINPQGVKRDALATYLEGAGSPIEQCSLLIYLLRKAGYPAAYVFPPQDTTLMIDRQLSKMLQFQIRGAMDKDENANLPELIPVNYPWVAFFYKDKDKPEDPGKWIHLFPWLKDTEVIEGKDIWNYFPSSCNTGTQWVLHYLLNDSNIRNLSDEDDLKKIFSLYAQRALNNTNLSLSDVGIKIINRKNNYTDWNDFPRPWKTPLISSDNLAQDLEATHNSKLNEQLKNIFDTVEITVFSDRNNKGPKADPDPDAPIIKTKPIRLADIHDRRLLLYHEVIQDTDPQKYHLILSLEPYDETNETLEQQVYAFDADTSASDAWKHEQRTSTILENRDDVLFFKTSYTYHQQAAEKFSSFYLNYPTQFPGVTERLTDGDTRPLHKGDMACLCQCYGGVTQKMLDFQANKIFNYQASHPASNNSELNLEQEIGQTLYLMGESYYYKTSEFKQFIEPLTKTHAISWFAHGFAKLSPERNKDRSPIITTINGIKKLSLSYPIVDMSFSRMAGIVPYTYHLDSSDTTLAANSTMHLMCLGNSINEHRIIDQFFKQDSAISTVKLLDIAQGWTPEHGMPQPSATNNILFLTGTDYEEQGKTPCASNKTLSEWAESCNLWSDIKNSFANSTTNNGMMNIVIIPKGPVTAPAQNGHAYTGMGAIILGGDRAAALISDKVMSDNGGYGGATPVFHENNGDSFHIGGSSVGGFFVDSGNSPNKQLLQPNPPDNNSNNKPLDPNENWFLPGGQYYHDPRFNTSSPGGSTSQPNNPTTPSQPSSPSQPIVTSPGNLQPSSPSPSPTPSKEEAVAEAKKIISKTGDTGSPVYYGKLKTFVMDPVSVVTGEFYINTVDLKLAGPMPLEIRRIYSSQSRVNENLGHGWKLSYFSYLALSDDSETTPSIINAAEMDGSVICYRYNADQKSWIPLPSDNPTLINENDGTTLTSHNLFNNRITQTTIDGATAYILSGADGSKRTFEVQSFPDRNNAALTRTRPYLDTWSDNQGNSYHFFFGHNQKSSDYGQLIRITSNNGNTIRFNYDSAGHIVEAFSNDGRLIKYTYDNNGDLIQVTLPDGSTIRYSYEIIDKDFIHLLTQEIKPDGRILKNIYDQQGRVTSQYATTSVSSKPTLSGTFNYSNLSTNADNTADLTTKLTDSSGNTTTYAITHNQISIITTQNRVTTQTWNFTDTTRSLASTTDPRGLKTTYDYDAQGNVISRSLTGNITGNGTSEMAKRDFKHNNRNCLASDADPVGNITSYTYGNFSLPYNPTSIVTTAASGQTINSIQIDYTKAGGACGLISSIKNNGATTTYTYNQHGFPNSITKKTGTTDPDVIATLTCNARGDITSATDTLGQKKKFYYDAFSRPTGIEIYDTTGALIDWHFNYYNFNGGIEWEQGARLNPVDYTYCDYDKAGHLIHKTIYLSTGMISSAGIKAGNSRLSTTSYSYDDQGNCRSFIDPNGNKTSMDYDTLGEMISRTLANGAHESFTYELGGKIATHTTVLGATESFTYTDQGLLQSASQANGTTTNYRYDLVGRLAKKTSSNGTACDITYNGNTITRTFSTSGKSLGSTSETYDPRGNLLEKTDIAGNQWNYNYDGLNRIKTEQGPPSSGNSAQQTITHYYALNFESLLNAAGEWINRVFDAVGRPILTTFYNKDGSVAQNISSHYSGDQQSVETTIGTDKNAITTTTYSNTRGKPLLIQHADGKYQYFTYDANGNLTLSLDEEGIGSTYTYDALNHIASQTINPDGTYIIYNCDAAGNLLTRSMPEGLKEQNSYNSAGQKESSSLIGSDGTITRNYTYHYQKGLLSSITDPRGFTTDIGYDDWSRLISLTSSGSSIPQQNQTTSYTYDSRGLLISVAQHYNDPATGPSTLVSRGYDAYGQLTSEITSLNGSPLSSWMQTWDEAGRRTALNWNLDKVSPAAQYQFSYNGLGKMTSSQNVSGTCSYAYANNGLLSQRTTPTGTTSLTRDARGRITDTLSTIDRITALSEHLDWTAGNRIQSYNVLENKFSLPQESRNYDYAGTKLYHEPYMMIGSANEQLFPNGTQIATTLFDETNFLQFNSGRGNGLGVRTSQLVGNAATSVSNENGFAQATEDKTYLGVWCPWANNYDLTGNLISRALVDITTQNLTWDSFQRLVAINQRSVAGPTLGFPWLENQWFSTYSWQTTYDGLGRRIQTTSGGNVINYYYDPEVEFLELGHNKNGTHTWNLYGPDRSGLYGGAQGIGGIERSYNQDSGTIKQWVNNYFGDAVGWYDSTAQSFSAPLLTLGAYGPMLGCPIPKVSDPQWRGHYIDETGLYYMGTRYYDPINGRFISPDPLGHASSLGLYDYCNGDPVNGLDPDGRCVEGASAGWTNGNGSFAGTYDSSQTSNPFAYAMGWTIGGALGTINGMAASLTTRPLAAIGQGYNEVTDFAEENLNLPPGSLTAATFMFAPLAVAGEFSEFAEGSNAAEIETRIVNQTTAIQPYFPANNGFLGVTEKQFLMKGEKINRYGGTGFSRFFSPENTPAMARSLPPGITQQPLRTFNVLKPFEVDSGTVAPAFGNPGFGKQLFSPVELKILLKRGILEEIAPSI